jgi:hypothetical protein
MNLRTKSTRSPHEPYPRLRLAVPEIDAPLASLQRLARRFHLDVHGSSGLFRITQIEMGFAALLLSAVFLFDFLLWTYTIQSLFTSVLPRLWIRLAVSIFGGLLIALVLIIYERQFITVELKGRAWVGFWIRLAVIALAALITARSLHLLVFDGPIQRRTWEQNVRVDAMNHIEELRRAADSLTGRDVNRYDVKATQGQINNATQTLSEQQQALTQAKQKQQQLQSDLAGEKARLTGMQQLLGEYRRKLQALSNSTEREQLTDEIRKLQSAQIPHSMARNAALNQQLGQIGLEIGQLMDLFTKTGLQINELTKVKLQYGVQGLKMTEEWNMRFRQIEVGKAPTVGPPLEVAPQDFFAKTAVLRNLIDGLSPGWPRSGANSDQEVADKQLLEREFGIVDRPISDPEHKTFVWEYYLVFGIGFLVPLMTIAFKFMMPEPLKKYYSSSYQSRLGNPEAIVFERAKEEYF